jgi:hypothetical protein
LGFCNIAIANGECRCTEVVIIETEAFGYVEDFPVIFNVDMRECVSNNVAFALNIFMFRAALFKYKAPACDAFRVEILVS